MIIAFWRCRFPASFTKFALFIPIRFKTPVKTSIYSHIVPNDLVDTGELHRLGEVLATLTAFPFVVRGLA